MKKALPLILIVAAVVCGLFFMQKSEDPHKMPVSVDKGGASVKTSATNAATNSSSSGKVEETGVAGLPVPKTEEGTGPDDEEEGAVDEKKATELYKSSDEALEAVKKASLDYDDAVIDQFSNLSSNCSWCPAFYSTLKDMMLSPETTTDQKSYFAELMAVSGSTDNIGQLMAAIKNAPNQEVSDLFTEALELTQGDDSVVSYLGSQLPENNSSPNVQEALVAAITNHGSKHAAEILYNQMVAKGDPDGYYSKGIGLSELIPNQDDPEIFSFLQGLALKRDQFSQNAVRALLNGGEPGLKIVLDVLSNSDNPEFDRAMLKDAKDHVGYEEGSEKILKETLERAGNKPVLREFVQSVLDTFNDQGSSDATSDTAGDTEPEGEADTSVTPG